MRQRRRQFREVLVTNRFNFHENYALDVMVYETPPFATPVRIAGPITAVLFAASSASDADWIVRLSDVDPAGNAYRLVDGVIRARYRETFTSAKLLARGKVERYEISLRSYENTWLPGHRVRVSVSSAAAGYLYPNTNTGEDEATVTRTVVAGQSVYHDSSRVSFTIICDAAKYETQ